MQFTLKRPTTKTENLYTYRNPEQIEGITGNIGYLRADYDSNGLGFYSSWFDIRKYLKNSEFKAEFDDVINELRENDFLKNRSVLSNYCYKTPESRMRDDEWDYFGVRVDTEKYTYLFRLNPNKGEYNIYCFCYIKEWFEAHLKNAAKGIRFVDTDYNDLFKIEDGEKVKLIYKDGIVDKQECRYIDDSHFESGNYIYHILEFAEKMKRSGIKVEKI